MLDPAAGRPLYLQLADLLRDGIESGKYPPRAPLPSARALSQVHGVAAGTVIRAFHLLAAEGLIITVTGRGMWVVPPEERPD